MSLMFEWIKLLRVHQWAKNLLIFVPVFTGHLLGDVSVIVRTGLAVLAFSIVASASYIINDLIDMESDRSHSAKKDRPLASGTIPPGAAQLAAGALLLLGLAACYALSASFTLAVLGYLVMTLAYSFRLKQFPLLDVGLIAAMFTLRILMGTLLHPLTVSPWLLSFSYLFFLSLALSKRHTELMRAREVGRNMAGRGYRSDDWPVTLAFGVSSAIASIVVMLMYIAEQGWLTAGYSSPEWLYVTPVCVLLWVLRIWLLSHRRELNEDSVLFALKDPASLLLGLAILLAGFAAK